MKKLQINVPTIIEREGLEDALIPIGEAMYLTCKDFVHISANGYTYRLTHDKFNYLINGKTWTKK